VWNHGTAVLYCRTRNTNCLLLTFTFLMNFFYLKCLVRSPGEPVAWRRSGLSRRDAQAAAKKGRTDYRPTYPLSRIVLRDYYRRWHNYSSTTIYYFALSDDHMSRRDQTMVGPAILAHTHTLPGVTLAGSGRSGERDPFSETIFS
jgi:hypothetical protein